jgi:arabinofuranan 3-O-arabinosyltransferase
MFHWAAETRELHVGAGPATYIALPQNFNPGWVARFGGQQLKSVRIDGWEQGFLVPGGNAGTVTMDMQPNGIYEVLLFVGAVFLLALAVLAFYPMRRKSRHPELKSVTPSFWLLLGLSGVGLVLVAGPWALALLPLLAVARRWGSRSMAAVAFLAFIVADAIAAFHPATLNAKTAAALTAPAQAAAVIALAAVLSALVADSRIKAPAFQGGRALSNGNQLTSRFDGTSDAGGSE